MNEQIAREFAAAHQYVGTGAHYAAQTFPRLSAYFYEQAEEEREHAMKMVTYLVNRDANVHFDYQSEQFLQWFLEEEAALSDLLEVAERTRQIPMLLEDYLARETPGKRAG